MKDVICPFCACLCDDLDVHVEDGRVTGVDNACDLYERNTFTISKMRQAGVEVVAIAGFELGKGRGGGHCMTCPILRDGI